MFKDASIIAGDVSIQKHGVLMAVKTIYIWTGYKMEELQERTKDDVLLRSILYNINYLIDGPFIEEQKDLRLAMRGSANQRIFHLAKGEPHEQHI